MTSEDINLFLDGAIRNRISIRLIAEQHIALSKALDAGLGGKIHNGILDMKVLPVDIIRHSASSVSDMCEATLGAAPGILINGQTDATLA